MMNMIPHAGVVVFTGRFGSGKSEAAINFALYLARKMHSDRESPTNTDQHRSANVILVDLDIVTPYFRSRESADRLLALDVKVIAPSVVGQHLDTPAITPQILGAIQQTELPVVLDVGGDKQGARALGQFSPAISQRGYTMHFVVNPFRPFTGTLEGLHSSIEEIQESARLKVSSLVSNPNLIRETTLEHILQGHAAIERYARALNLPIAFVCVEHRWLDAIEAGPAFSQPVLSMDRNFVMSWE